MPDDRQRTPREWLAVVALYLFIVSACLVVWVLVVIGLWTLVT